MWHEVVAGRAANQIASFLYHFLNEKNPDYIEEITFYNDTCGGQNKNNHVACMFQVLLNHPTLKTINHTFLTPSSYRKNEEEGWYLFPMIGIN